MKQKCNYAIRMSQVLLLVQLKISITPTKFSVYKQIIHIYNGIY